MDGERKTREREGRGGRDSRQSLAVEPSRRANGVGGDPAFLDERRREGLPGEDKEVGEECSRWRIAKAKQGDEDLPEDQTECLDR